MFDVLQLLDGHDHSVNFFACFNQLWFLLGRIGEEIITWGRHVFVFLLLVSIGKIVKGCAWRYGNPKQWMPYIQLAVGLFGRTAAEPSWNHHLSFEGWKSFDWRATSMRRNWPSQTSIWSHRRSPLGGLFFGTVFFSAEIFLPDGRESNGSVKEVGGSVSSQGQTDFDTHMITHAQFICCYQLSLYIYIHYICPGCVWPAPRWKNVMIHHYCGLFSGKQRRGKGHAGSSTRGGMSSWMSLVMFLESSMSLQRKPTISHECMCWGCRNPGESGKILFIAILIFCK